MALEQARKKLAEKRMTPAPAQDPAVSEREKRLTLTLTQMEKQTASSTALMEQAKAETERLRKELIRTNERLSSTESESRARIDELERMVHAAALSAEAAKKVIEEQSRLSKRLTEENAALSSRQPGLQAEIQNLTAAAQNSQQELAAARLMLDEATTALAGERKWREKAAEEAVVERKKLETKIDRMQQEPARIEKRATARRRIVAYVVACGIAFVAGLVVRGLVGSIAVRLRGGGEAPAMPEASRSAVSTNTVKRLSVISQTQTNIAGSRAAGRATTGGVQTVAASLPAALKWPDIAVDGIVVTRTNRSMVMVFKYGTFSSMAVLKDRARKDLGIVAGRLKNRTNEFCLVVVGHTDSVPVGTNTVSGGNYELGLARARAVTSYLAKDCGLPTDSLVAVSAGGGSDTPYANTDEDSRQKNRTVVLKLIPLVDAPARKP
jgi:flagellar motor protein MotB